MNANTQKNWGSNVYLAATALLIAAVIVSPGQASAKTVYILEPVVAHQQKVIPANIEMPVPKLASKKKNIVVIGPQESSMKRKGELAFNVVVINRTDQNFVFSTEQITANVADNDLDVLTFQQLEEKKRKSAAKKRFFTAIVGAALTKVEMDATTKSGMAFQGLALDIAAKTDQAIVESTEDAIGVYKESILKPGDVISGRGHGGYFVVDRPKKLPNDSRILLRIDVGGEVHDFAFKWVKTTSQCQDTKLKIITAQSIIGSGLGAKEEAAANAMIEDLQERYDTKCR